MYYFSIFCYLETLELIYLYNQATKAWNESTLNRILQLTEEANSNKPKLQRWLDEFGEIYSKVVVVLSIAIAFLGPILFEWPFLGTTGNV